MTHFTHPGCKAKQELLAEKPPLLARYTGSPQPRGGRSLYPAMTPAGFVSRTAARGMEPGPPPGGTRRRPRLFRGSRPSRPPAVRARRAHARPHTHPGKGLGNAGEPRARSSPYGTHTNGLARSAAPGPGRRLRVHPAATASSPPPWRRFIPPGAAGRAPRARVPPPAATAASRSPPSRSRAGARRPAVNASPLAPSPRPP